jgi:hypothetical protein
MNGMQVIYDLEGDLDLNLVHNTDILLMESPDHKSLLDMNPDLKIIDKSTGDIYETVPHDNYMDKMFAGEKT